jgi:hypothetical protein
MGDRGNFVMKQADGNKIYFYTHWSGNNLPFILREALIRGRDRWDDEPYLARIIFCELVKGREMDTTGYGISTYECDNEHPHFIIDSSKQTVERDGETWAFKEFSELDSKILNLMV